MSTDESTVGRTDGTTVHARVTAVLDALGGGADPATTLRELDSVGLVELVVQLEEEFGLEIPDEALADEVFSSIDALSATMTRLRGE